MWGYEQATGLLTAPDGSYAGKGYSGHGPGLNNPAMEADQAVGPIPKGKWSIGTPKTPVDHLGPLAMPLTMLVGDTFGRSAFFIHGDFAGDTQELASLGCIILEHGVRQALADSDDKVLVVS